MSTRVNRGVLSIIGAYLLWGLFPFFWKSLREVPADEILGHRVVWSFLFLSVLLAVGGEWSWLGKALSSRRTLVTFFGTAALIGANWLTYTWAVNSGFIVECSLGYFINPLPSVFLGMIFLQGTSGCGVPVPTLSPGGLPTRLPAPGRRQGSRDTCPNGRSAQEAREKAFGRPRKGRAAGVP